MVSNETHNFDQKVEAYALDLSPTGISTLQVNLTRLCNQACHHCHVDASPKRTESMSLAYVETCLKILSETPSITTLDLTGGAPELHPHFDYFVERAVALNKKVIVRHNLTVTFDGNPITKESKEYLPKFFAQNRVEVVSSLPCYQESNTDKQRGFGVFQKSIAALKRLNHFGYGLEKSGLVLNLVYNPVGAFLPPDQNSLEHTYKKELFEKYGIQFTTLFVLTNMPIHRMKKQLEKAGEYQSYMDKLSFAFNSDAAKNVMCRSMLSVSYDGKIFDCDFNQMLNMPVKASGIGLEHIENWDFTRLKRRSIQFADHCFGCTAGSGSSCRGATT